MNYIKQSIKQVRNRIRESKTGCIKVAFAPSTTKLVDGTLHGMYHVRWVTVESFDHVRQAMVNINLAQRDSRTYMYVEGTTDELPESALRCPMCETGIMHHGFIEREDKSISDETYAWICEQCPAVLVEWLDNEDGDNVNRIIAKGEHEQ